MTEIDWEAAKSGKRLLRLPNGTLARYLAELKGGRYAVAIANASGEYAETYRDNGTSLTGGPHLVQDPEVIEFKRWVNVYPDQSCVLWITEDDAIRIRDEAVITTAPLTIRITGDKVEIFGGTE